MRQARIERALQKNGGPMRTTTANLAVTTRLTQLAMCVSALFGVQHTVFATNVTDCSDGGGANTLRSVIANAASGDITNVSQCSLITLTQGEIATNLSRVRIQGNGSNIISGNNNSRIINHTGTGGYLLLLDVTIQNGKRAAANALGGCVYSSGPRVSLDHATIRDCNATETAAGGVAKGGGVYAKNVLDLRDSVVTGNTATQQSSSYFKAYGGGVFATTITAYNSSFSNNTLNSTGGLMTAKYTQGGGAFSSGTAKLYSCTLSNNVAGKYAAAMLNKGGAGGVVIADSTISGNIALHKTGGVWLGAGAATVANSTIAFNSSYDTNGPEGVLAKGILVLQSSIIAKNTYNSGTESDLGGSGSVDAASANNLIITSSLAVPADTIHLDPRLLPLANNGGATQTHALDAGSPAIDHGNAVFNFSNFVPVSCDQRGNPGHEMNPPNTYSCGGTGGFLRTDSDPKHSKPDIGAYEEQFPNPDWVFYDGFGF